MPMRTMHRVNGLMFQDLLRYEKKAREMSDQKDGSAQCTSAKRLAAPSKAELLYLAEQEQHERGMMQADAYDDQRASLVKEWALKEALSLCEDTLRHVQAAYNVPDSPAINLARQAAQEALTDSRTPAECAPQIFDDDDHMVKIGKLITDLQAIKDHFGDTCVYIRRAGLSWGAVALNRRDDDQKNGVFDLQADHDKAMLARLEQIERLIEARHVAEQEVNRLTAQVEDARAALRSIAEGNLGDASWQASYETIKQVARNALSHSSTVRSPE